MLGAYGVGKTSLVRQFVHSIFSEAYQSTIGVRIEKKEVPIGDRTLRMMIWDVAGEEEFQQIPPSFILGAAGCLIVADGTRSHTVGVADAIRERVAETLGRDIPQLLLVNKCDLAEEWSPPREEAFIPTSARTGEGVEEAFAELAREIL